MSSVSEVYTKPFAPPLGLFPLPDNFYHPPNIYSSSYYQKSIRIILSRPTWNFIQRRQRVHHPHSFIRRASQSSIYHSDPLNPFTSFLIVHRMFLDHQLRLSCQFRWLCEIGIRCRRACPAPTLSISRGDKS